MGDGSGLRADVCPLPRSGDQRCSDARLVPQRQQNPPVLESMEIVVAVILMAICWFAWYVARERFYFTNRQIAELACYLALGGLAIAGPPS